jgi:hypothetical protein
VRLGDASVRDSDRLAAAGFLGGADLALEADADEAERAGDFFFARADFAGFLAAIWSSSRRRRLCPRKSRVKAKRR